MAFPETGHPRCIFLRTRRAVGRWEVRLLFVQDDKVGSWDVTMHAGTSYDKTIAASAASIHHHQSSLGRSVTGIETTGVDSLSAEAALVSRVHNGSIAELPDMWRYRKLPPGTGPFFASAVFRPHRPTFRIVDGPEAIRRSSGDEYCGDFRLWGSDVISRWALCAAIRRRSFRVSPLRDPASALLRLPGP